jgi:glutathione S-transferase
MTRTMQQARIELINSKGCPYSLGCLAALCATELDYTLTEVPMQAIPDWVVQLTPKGQVPVLRVGERAFFESNIICELINDLAGGVLLPEDPLERAWMRTWSRHIATLSPLLYQTASAATREVFEAKLAQLAAEVQPLEHALASAPEPAPGRIQIIDCAYYGFFTRLLHLESELGIVLVEAPRLWHWARTATDTIDPMHPVLADHGGRFVRHLVRAGGYLVASGGTGAR